MPVYSDKCQDSTACICQSFKYFKIKASLEKKEEKWKGNGTENCFYFKSATENVML